MNFKNINKKIYLLQCFVTIFAVVLCEFGIGCFYTARLGTDPISIFVEGVSFHCSLTVGQISTICNAILCVLMFIFERKNFGFGTLIQVFIGGPLIDFFYAILLKYFNPDVTAMSIRIIILFVGLIIYSIGLGLTIICDIGVGPFSFPTMYLNDYTPLNMKYSQIVSDATFFIVGLLLGGVYGFGSIVTVFMCGPIMDYTIKITKPKLDSLGSLYLDNKK